MPSSILRFIKVDQYSNHVFMVKESEVEETKTFEQLGKLQDKLAKKFPDSFLPIYTNDTTEYRTIRFGRCKYSFKRGNYYNITYKFKARENTYVNATIQQSKIFKRVERPDSGADVELSESE